MPITFTQTAWNSGGSGSGSTTYKDVTVSCAAGDLLVAVGVNESDSGASGAVSTQSGSTGSWTVTTGPGSSGNDVGSVIGYATVLSGTSVTVRVTCPQGSGGVYVYMGAGVFVVPAADWTGTPGVTSFGGADADGQVSVTLSATSAVFYAAGDWTATNPGTSNTPTGGTNDTTYYDNSHYAVAVRHWTGQASGTRNYGPSGLSGKDYAGLVIAVEEAAGGTTLTVAPLDLAVALDGVTLTQAHTLTVAALDHTVALDGPLTLTQTTDLVPASLDHAVTVDQVTLTPTVQLDVASLDLAVTIDQVALAQAHTLTVAPLDHTVALDGPLTLTLAGQLEVAPLDLAVTIDQVTLTQAHTLTVAPLDHTVTLDGPLTLTEHTAGALVVQPLDLVVALDQVTLTQAHTLTVAPLDHTVTLDGPLTITVQAVQLTAAGIDHTVTLDGVALSVTHVLVVQSLLLAVWLGSAESVSWSLWVGGVEVSCTLHGVYDGSVVQPVATVEVVS